MEFFHYTSSYSVPKIQEKGLTLGMRFILSENKSLVATLPEAAFERAIFGLLEPLPSAWCREVYSGCFLLERLLSDVSGDIALFKVNVPAEAKIDVADWGPHFDKDFQNWYFRSDEAFDRVKTEYFNSLTPLATYRATGKAHRIPEVICWSPIAPENLSLIEVVPYKKVEERIREVREALPAPAI